MDPIGTAEKLPAVAKGLGGMLGDPTQVEGLLLIIIGLLILLLVWLFRRLFAVTDRLVDKLDKVEKLTETVTRTAATQGHASDRMVTVSDRVAEAIMVLSEYQETARRRAHGRE